MGRITIAVGIKDGIIKTKLDTKGANKEDISLAMSTVDIIKGKLNKLFMSFIKEHG